MILETVRVLLVEDDEDDYVLTKRMLEEVATARFEICWASDFESAMQFLSEREFDVGLVDYRLGPTDGIEFIRKAVERGYGVPLILLTGIEEHTVDLAAMNAGAADFICKAHASAAALERSIRYSIQQKRTEEQRLTLHAEHAARLELEAENRAKDRFLATLSHELRTPLTPILMSVSELERRDELPLDVQQLVGLIKRNAELEARLIDDLLDLTKVAHGKLELERRVVDVHDQIRHAIDTCGDEQFRAKRLDLQVELRARRQQVLGDPARLQQVFWNLIKNAIKFTPEAGQIRIATRNGDDHQLVVEVIDTGIGIAPEGLPRIFHAFEQGGNEITRQFGGLGLGLSITRAIVEQHAGSIRAESEGEGKGACFTVQLPALREDVTQTKPQEQRGPGTRTAPGGRILLVEDHADTRRIMARLLEQDGYSVHSAGSVAAALEVMRKQPIDLLISDIGLPDGSGLELMRQLQQRQSTKGIALTGYGMEEDLQRSHEAGFVAHLTKPIDLPKLRKAVQTALSTAGESVD